MNLLHFQQLWVVMTALVCQLNHLSRVITDWCETLNELSSQMTIQVHMYRSSSFIWSLIVSWTFSWAFSWIIASSDFVCSSKSYLLTWSHMQTFILCLYDILVMFECRAFHFIASQSTCSSDQQSCSCQSVAVILSWNHVHWFQFVIQIQFMSSVCKLCRMKSYLLIHSSCCLW